MSSAEVISRSYQPFRVSQPIFLVCPGLSFTVSTPSAYCSDFNPQAYRCGAVVAQLQFNVLPAAAAVDGDVDAERRARRRAFQFVLVPVGGAGDDDVEGAGRDGGEVHVLPAEDVHVPGVR